MIHNNESQIFFIRVYFLSEVCFTLNYIKLTLHFRSINHLDSSALGQAF